MTRPFPPIMAPEFDEPMRLEGDIYDLEIMEGEIPVQIDGLYVQAVPEQQYPPETTHITMMDASANGDGSVRAFRIKDGKVDFKARYVRTERFLAERAARRSLFGHYRNPFSDHPSVAGKDRTTANTAVYFHAGVLLASKEDGPAYALDPESLATLGPWRANGAIKSKTWTAHPKVDPRTGEMFGFGYAAKGECTPDIAYYVVDRSGTVTHEAWMQAPVAAMIHDCAVTDNFMIFPIMPFTSDIERLRQGGLHFQYEPAMEQIFGVLPRKGTAEQVRWFRGPPGFPGHTVNAFEADGKIFLDLLEADGNAFGPMFPDREGRIAAPGSIKTHLVRWTIDYSAKDLKLSAPRRMARVTGEGPHIDERFAIAPYRYVWVPGMDPARRATDHVGRPMPGLFNTINCLDLEAGTIQEWFAGPTASFQDPVYIPPADKAAPEGDGYIAVIVNWPLERRNEFVLLEAKRLASGPVARIRIPIRFRTGIHAAWITGDRLASPSAAQHSTTNGQR